MKSFWQDLKKPIFVLAPMEDVTDTVFRRVVASCGRPDVFFTEFTSVDGLSSIGHDYVAKRLKFTEDEHPLIAQIWGVKPENYYKAAQMLVEMGFDGIDINMGCPVKDVTKLGACSALIKNHPLAKEIIQATKDGAGALPVSVKTRIGFNEIQTEEWIGFLLDQGIDALTVHGRTVKEQSKVPAHWDEITKAVKLRDEKKLKTVIIGNGDVMSRDEAMQRVKETGADGIMIGRGIFHDPWLFNPTHHGEAVSFKEKLQKMSEHISLFEKTWGKDKHYPILKKFFKCYISGIPGASDMRTELIAYNSSEEVLKRLKELQVSDLT
jgi:nifR3 family TIM-barrel protein